MIKCFEDIVSIRLALCGGDIVCTFCSPENDGGSFKEMQEKQPPRVAFSFSTTRRYSGRLTPVDARIDSTAGGRPNFPTTQWGLVAAASAEGAAEARAALEELYRLYCYPVYAFIR